MKQYAAMVTEFIIALYLFALTLHVTRKCQKGRNFKNTANEAATAFILCGVFSKFTRKDC